MSRQPLVEVVQRDVGPHVGRQIVRDPVGVGDVGVQVGLPVVRLDLRGERIPHQSQALDEGPGERRPVGFRDRDDVGAEGPRRTVELAQVLGALDAADLPRQPCGEDGHLLADRRRSGRLPVRVGEHGQAGVLTRQSRQGVGQGSGCGKPHLLDRPLDAQRIGEIVDVFARAEGVDHVAQSRQDRCRAEGGRRCVETPSDEVFDRLDVVAGLRLDRGEFCHLGLSERGGDGPQEARVVFVDDRSAGDDAFAGQEDEPLDLDSDAFAIEGGFGKIGGQRGGGGAVASVEGAESESHADIVPRSWRGIPIVPAL